MSFQWLMLQEYKAGSHDEEIKALYADKGPADVVDIGSQRVVGALRAIQHAPARETGEIGYELLMKEAVCSRVNFFFSFF